MDGTQQSLGARVRCTPPHSTSLTCAALPSLSPEIPQVERATYHNARQGLSAQCKAVRGNFLEMPFEVRGGGWA